MKLVRLLLIITCALFISAWIMSDSYLNSHKIPVAIKTSGWIPFFGDDSESMIVLQEGDLYDDGYVYEKYGLIDGITKEFAEQNIKPSRTPYKEINKQLEEECDEFQAAIDNKTLPDNWKCYYRGSYENQCAKLLQKIDILKSSRQSNDEKKTKHLKAEYAFYTNRFSDPKIFEKISDPDFDMDKDGLSNLEEFYSDSDPMVKNSVAIYPTRVKLIADGSAVCTGVFYVANLTATNISFHLENNYRSSDDRYAPKIVPVDAKFGLSKNGLMFINMPPASKQKFLYLLDSKYLPYCFSTSYGVTACFNNNSTWSDDYIGHINFYMFGNKGHEITKATDLHPKSGSKLQQDNSLYFRWRSGEKNVSIKRAYEIRYVIQFYNVNKKMSFDYFCFTNTWFAPEKNDLNTFSPGLYFWRVIKQDAFSAPFCTDWNWFAVGREATCEKPKKRYGDQAHIGGYNGAEVIFATVGERYDLPIHFKSTSNSRFLKPLPPDQEVYYKTSEAEDPNRFHITGVFEKTGVYSNIWLNIGIDGKTNEYPYIFIVRNPSTEKNVRSFYYLNEKTVVHELFVNVLFKFKERLFFEALSKKDDLIWDENLKIDFGKALPEGLTAKRSGNGDDLEIKGVPSVAGVFKVDLVFSNSNRSVEERHVFRIKDIGEPPFEFERKIFIPKKKKKRTSSVFTEEKNMVNHYSYVGIDFEYPVYVEAYPRYTWPEDYWRFAKSTKIEIIGDPAPGLKVGNVPFCTNYGTKAKVATLGFFGKPTQAGKFTNTVVLAEKDLVITNMHIFSIKQDLD